MQQAGVVWCEAPNIMEIVLIDITNIGEICPDCEGTGAGRGGGWAQGGAPGGHLIYWRAVILYTPVFVFNWIVLKLGLAAAHGSTAF